METKDRNQEQRRTRPQGQRAEQSAQRPRQPQSAAQRRAVKHQQTQRQAVQQRQAAQQRQGAQAQQPARRRPANAVPVRRKKKKTGLLAGIRLPQFGKPTTPRGKREQAARAAKLNAMRQEVARQGQTNKTRRRVSKPRKPSQPLVYTAPATFNAHRLVMQLVTITAIVLAAVMCLSIFFKVEVIEVSGAEVYDIWTIREASGIQEGENLLTFSRGRASGRIKTQLQYVDKVRFGIKLPNTVIIDIKEFDVVYSIKATDGTWYLINSDGKVIEMTDGGTAGNYTKILGVELSAPMVGEQARAAEAIQVAPESTTAPPEDGVAETTVPQVLITNQSRLETALRILRSLELNGIVGEAASVNVSDLSHIELWYGTRYQVNLGDENNMDKKIADMNATISQLAEYQNGILDISYTIWEDRVVYTPFS